MQYTCQKPNVNYNGNIVDIIDNKIYIGYVPLRKYVKELNQKKRTQVSKKDIKWYKGLHEPIVPLELCEFCQSIREKNSFYEKRG